MKGIEDRIKEMADEVALPLGLEVEEVRLIGRGRTHLLRVTIDKPGGVGIADCEAVSRDLSAMLDVEDAIKSRYTLEVSSPGLDRPLKERKDFIKQAGKLVRVVVKEKIDGQGFFIGRLMSVGDGGIVISVGEREMEIGFDNISKARLEIEIK